MTTTNDLEFSGKDIDTKHVTSELADACIERLLQKEPTEEEKKEDEDKKYFFLFEDFCKEAGLIHREDWEFIMGITDIDGNTIKKGGRNFFKSGAIKIGKLLAKKGYVEPDDESDGK